MGAGGIERHEYIHNGTRVYCEPMGFFYKVEDMYIEPGQWSRNTKAIRGQNY